MLKSIRRNKIVTLLGLAAGSLIVWQHKCIMEALEIINEAGLQDKIR